MPLELEVADTEPRDKSPHKRWDPDALLNGPNTWRPDQYSEGEKYWLGLRNTLDEKGYALRPRYREGWVPSWLGTETSYYHTEDGQTTGVRSYPHLQ